MTRDVITRAERVEVDPGLVEILVKTEEMVVGEDVKAEGVMVETGAVVKEVIVVGGLVVVDIGIKVDGEEVELNGEAVSC